MIQFISFSDINGTYAYRIMLTNTGGTFQWVNSFAQNGQLSGSSSGADLTLQGAFSAAFNALTITSNTNSAMPIPTRVQYMVSNGMLDSNDIASVLSRAGFTPTGISCY